MTRLICILKTTYSNVSIILLQRDFKQRSSSGMTNGHCSNGIVIGEEKPTKITLPRRGSRSSKRQQQQQQKKFLAAKFHEQERGISLEFGKFVALISISGKLL